jgi:hypothetical protein
MTAVQQALEGPAHELSALEIHERLGYNRCPKGPEAIRRLSAWINSDEKAPRGLPSPAKAFTVDFIDQNGGLLPYLPSRTRDHCSDGATCFDSLFTAFVICNHRKTKPLPRICFQGREVWYTSQSMNMHKLISPDTITPIQTDPSITVQWLYLLQS